MMKTGLVYCGGDTTQETGSGRKEAETTRTSQSVESCEFIYSSRPDIRRELNAI
jgi:hypothetical protein